MCAVLSAGVPREVREGYQVMIDYTTRIWRNPYWWNEVMKKQREFIDDYRDRVLESLSAHAEAANDASDSDETWDCAYSMLDPYGHDCHKMPENIRCETDSLNQCIGDCRCYCSTGEKGLCNVD